MSGTKQQALQVWWIIWGALLTGIFMIHQFVPASASGPFPETTDQPVWLLATLPLAAASVIRWLVLPRATQAAAALPLFVVGMALAESTFMAGMFLFPAHKQELLILSALGIFQFVPLFAGKYYESSGR